jgi:bacterioferritin-associated ferredoxin
MIVCVCNAICERRLEAVIIAGADTAEKVERNCGAGGDCGACRPDIERAIERTMGGPARRMASLPTLPPGVTG